MFAGSTRRYRSLPEPPIVTLAARGDQVATSNPLEGDDPAAATRTPYLARLCPRAVCRPAPRLKPVRSRQGRSGLHLHAQRSPLPRLLACARIGAIHSGGVRRSFRNQFRDRILVIPRPPLLIINSRSGVRRQTHTIEDETTYRRWRSAPTSICAISPDGNRGDIPCRTGQRDVWHHENHRLMDMLRTARCRRKWRRKTRCSSPTPRLHQSQRACYRTA